MKRALALGVVALTVLLAGLPAAGAAPDATGWWSRARLGNPLLPTDLPSTVPEGGLYVAADPTGPAGISALRYAVGEEAVTDLVLEIDSAQGTPAVRACPTPVAWADEQGGPLASAPAGDCDDAEVVGVVEEGTLRFPVGALVRDGLLNVVLDPVPGSVFQATFRPPGDAAIVTSGSEEAEPLPAFPEPVGAAEVPGPVAGTLAPLPPVQAPAPAVSGGDATAPAVAPDTEVAAPVAVVRESNRPRVLAAVVLFDLALAYLWLVRRAPDDAVTLGIGRFARVRTGPVPRL